MERNYIKEKKAAVKEFEDKKVELKENLIAELEEKKKMIENEKLTMELTGGTKMIENETLTMEVTGGVRAPQSRIQGSLRGSSREGGTPVLSPASSSSSGQSELKGGRRGGL